MKPKAPTLSGFQPISEIMHRIIETGNAWPKVRLSANGQPIALTVAGSKARMPGAINITDGRGFGSGVYFGRITPNGEFEPSRSAREMDVDTKVEFWSILTRMRDGKAEEVFAEFGHAFGTCCLCGRELSNEESVQLGIGPICRKRAFPTQTDHSEAAA